MSDLFYYHSFSLSLSEGLAEPLNPPSLLFVFENRGRGRFRIETNGVINKISSPLCRYLSSFSFLLVFFFAWPTSRIDLKDSNEASSFPLFFFFYLCQDVSRRNV